MHGPATEAAIVILSLSLNGYVMLSQHFVLICLQLDYLTLADCSHIDCLDL